MDLESLEHRVGRLENRVELLEREINNIKDRIEDNDKELNKMNIFVSGKLNYILKLVNEFQISLKLIKEELSKKADLDVISYLQKKKELE